MEGRTSKNVTRVVRLVKQQSDKKCGTSTLRQVRAMDQLIYLLPTVMSIHQRKQDYAGTVNVACKRQLLC